MNSFIKKSVSITLLALCLVIVLSSTLSAFSPKASITASSESVAANDTVIITVNVFDCTSKSLGIIPDYDKNSFELVSGEFLVSDAALSDFSDGCAVIAYDSEKVISGDIFRFVLKVKSSIKSGDHTVKCDIQAEGYSLSTPSVILTVSTITGDVNNDGFVDNKDVVALFRYVSGGAKAENESVYDFNADGNVDNKDVVALFRYVSS